MPELSVCSVEQPSFGSNYIVDITGWLDDWLLMHGVGWQKDKSDAFCNVGGKEKIKR
jgi:hypothetical protein